MDAWYLASQPKQAAPQPMDSYAYQLPSTNQQVITSMKQSKSADNITPISTQPIPLSLVPNFHPTAHRH